MASLKDLLASRKNEESDPNRKLLTPIIHEQAMREGLESRKNRRRGIFHPSEVGGEFCPRQWILCNEVKPEIYLEEKISSNLQMRFSVGHALHDMIAGYLGRAGVLFGRWVCLRRCRGEKCEHFGFYPGDSCGSEDIDPIWVYQEVPVRYKKYMIFGRSDGIVDTDDGKYIVECKTAHDDSFSTMVEPFVNHQMQGLFYLDGLRYMQDKMEEWVETERELEFVRQKFEGVIFLYLNKNTQDTREFILPSHGYRKPIGQDTMLRDMIDKRKQELKKTWAHKIRGTVPERICKKKSEKRAQKCLAKDLCFDCEKG